MIRTAKAKAYANIALIKYWGKKDESLNTPATPSISLAIDCLSTETTVTSIKAKNDQIFLNGEKADSTSTKRISRFIDIYRKKKMLTGSFRVESSNSFPTAAGLASSASGFAALAKALSAFVRKTQTDMDISRLARMGSGSAARSVTGGLSHLPIGMNPASRLLRTPDEIDWGMVIAIAETDKKKVASRSGMKLSESSPYYNAWIRQASKDCKAMLGLVEKDDFAAIGELAEANALAMHACMISARPGIVYWSPATIRLMDACRRYRESGLECYFTIDAGANVIFISRLKDIRKLVQRLRSLKSVKRVLSGKPAGGAEIEFEE